MSLKREAMKLITEKKVKKISENIFHVDSYRTEFKLMPGRTLMICSCEHHAKFCNQPALCKHKVAGLYFWLFPPVVKLFQGEEQPKKEIKEIAPRDKCPPWLRQAYIKAVGNKCQECPETKGLEIHRIIPGYKGGEYLPQNCRVLCMPCHDRYDEPW